MRWLTVLTISLALAGCGLLQKKPLPPPPAKTVATTTFVNANCGTPPPRSEIAFRPIVWRILEVKGEQMFTLTAKGYEDAAFNESEKEKGVKELKAEIQYYLDCLSQPIAVPQGD